MTRAPRRSVKVADLVRAAEETANGGNLDLARALLGDALKQEPRNADIRTSRARLAAAQGDMSSAIADLTGALKVSPGHTLAARALADLAQRYVFEDLAALDPAGLVAALKTEGVARRPLAAVAITAAFAVDPTLDTLRTAVPAEIDRAVPTLVARKLYRGLTSELLLTALRSGPAQDAGIERVLTSARKGLLDAGAATLENADHFNLALALAQQGAINDYAWLDTEAERSAVDALGLDGAKLSAGDVDAGRRLLLAMLYRPLADLLPADFTVEKAAGVRPKALRDVVALRLKADEEEATIRKRLTPATAFTDPTSSKVAAQYVSAPYPRWDTVQIPTPGSLVRALARFVPEVSVKPLQERAFDVLIAGAGTGQQVVQSAIGYGTTARIHAIDLSPTSLAYAERMARRMGLATVDFAVADILDLPSEPKSFDVIECIGVLHHMADPFLGWRKLAARLKPNGLMYVGLYSHLARANIREVRAMAGAPKPGCSDADARAWRRKLMDGVGGEAGATIVRSRNFSTLNEFRDLVLHESETQVTIEQIQAFLGKTGLSFHGFTLPTPVMQDFGKAYPDHAWPGRLEDWSAFETANPRTFDGMYCFWVSAAGP